MCKSWTWKDGCEQAAHYLIQLGEAKEAFESVKPGNESVDRVIIDSVEQLVISNAALSMMRQFLESH
jgi:hypothetical protein